MAGDLVYPLFLIDGISKAEDIPSMPGQKRLSLDKAIETCQRASECGIRAVALFPAIDESLKDEMASESQNPDGLFQRAIGEIKSACPELALIGDVAMDPYSSSGHDGLLKDGKIVNDGTLEILAQMALSQAKSGVDIVAPSDMMDGRVGFIRRVLDEEGFSEVGILSYAAKYCSAFYGPFRDALQSVPKSGDKKTYQMDPANSTEALREVRLDVEEGADIVMVKPGLLYLDIISEFRRVLDIPIAAYSVSGEYAMIEAAGQKGWVDRKAAISESLLCLKRAGANIIFSYHALEYAEQDLFGAD